ncbi:MAG TPA: WS/DGAT domain-containing protein [Solirubrobacteraceae bacterium]|nr:WS/DGAT domain-containing protein [Solirubrobacteraceae bacterium]
MHHCIADGIALARVMLSLTDSRADAGIAPPAVERRRRLVGVRLERLGRSTEGVLGTAAHAGAAAIRRGTDIVISPSHAARLAGALTRDGATSGPPTSGHIGMSVSIFSYPGEITVCLMVDAAPAPDPENVVTQLEHELDALERVRRVGSRRRPRAVKRGSASLG